MTKRFIIDKSSDIVHQRLLKLTSLQPTKDGVIEFKLKPSFFEPFSGRGRIKFQIVSLDNIDKTAIDCEIFPNSFPKVAIYLVGAFMFLWTMVSLLIFFSFYMLLTVSFGWTLLFLTVYWTQTLNKAKLDNYVTMIIKNIR